METDELTRYLASLEREECYRVDATMKESPHEITQRVYFIGANGSEQGPYVRKLIRRESGMGAAYERIFQAQQRGRRFKHIPRLLECYQHDEYLVVVMEFAGGVTLQDLVYSRNPSTQLAFDVFPRICDAVTELHEAFDPPLIHRDLKPSNVMVSDDALTIIDFGIARELKRDAEADTTKFGTRAFAPPEQFGFGQTTVRSDVYALGMILYFCLTEEIPTASARDGEFSSASVPEQIRPVLVRATALDPQERYASASELKAAFVGAAEPTIGHASTQHDKPNAHKHRIAAATGGVFAVAIAAAALIGPGLPPSSPESSDIADDQKESQRASAETTSDESATPEHENAVETLVSEDMSAGAPQRNGFDPTTNFTTTIAGVTFQLPSYYGTNVSQGDAESTYYYAESGSSLAMLMTAESKLSDEDGVETDIEHAKDSFIAGVISSDENLFSEITSSTDWELAGWPARIVTFRGTAQGLPITSKAVFFIETDPADGTYTVGSLFLGQTDNALFDYSSDFAQTIASAITA